MPETMPDALRRWFEQPLGQYLYGQEQLSAGRLLPDLFGYHIIQIGGACPYEFLKASRIAHKLVLAHRNEGPCCGGTVPVTRIKGSAESLAITADSMDVVLLPHVLEYAVNPHKVLREAERVLIGEGYLVLFGFNPWSLWGLWRLALAWRDEAPWNGHFYGLARIRDWLNLLDLEVVSVDRLAFRPPLRSPGAMHRLRVLDYLGRHVWPMFGGAYMVVAKKRVVPLTLVTRRWSTRRGVVAPGVVEPSARKSGIGG